MGKKRVEGKKMKNPPKKKTSTNKTKI